MGENMRTGQRKGFGAVASRVSNQQPPHHQDVDVDDVDEGEVQQDDIDDIKGGSVEGEGFG